MSSDEKASPSLSSEPRPPPELRLPARLVLSADVPLEWKIITGKPRKWPKDAKASPQNRQGPAPVVGVLLEGGKEGSLACFPPALVRPADLESVASFLLPLPWLGLPEEEHLF